MNPYKVLGIKKNASQDQIVKAYRKKARQYHPDRNPGNTEEAETKFKEVQLAYECLSDPLSRKHYDNTGEVKPTKSIDDALFNILGNTFQHILKAVFEFQLVPGCLDLLGAMLERLRLTELEMKDDVKEITKALDQIRDIKKRITDKNGQLLKIVEMEEAATEGMLDKVKERLERIDAARAYINDMDYNSQVAKANKHIRDQKFSGFMIAFGNS